MEKEIRGSGVGSEFSFNKPWMPNFNIVAVHGDEDYSTLMESVGALSYFYSIEELRALGDGDIYEGMNRISDAISLDERDIVGLAVDPIRPLQKELDILMLQVFPIPNSNYSPSSH